MARGSEQSPVTPEKTNRPASNEVFSQESNRKPSFSEKLKLFAEKFIGRSHLKYENMPGEMTVEELVSTIQVQNSHLVPDQTGKISLTGNEKQYRIGLEDPNGVLEADVQAIFPEKSYLTIHREIGDVIKERALDPSQQLRFTMMRDEKPQSRTSA